MSRIRNTPSHTNALSWSAPSPCFGAGNRGFCRNAALTLHLNVSISSVILRLPILFRFQKMELLSRIYREFSTKIDRQDLFQSLYTWVLHQPTKRTWQVPSPLVTKVSSQSRVAPLSVRGAKRQCWWFRTSYTTHNNTNNYDWTS